MKKISVIGLSFFAVFAFSVVAATSAFAVSKVLVGGAEVGVGGIPFSVEPDANLLLLEDMGVAGKPDILCSGFLKGTIAQGGTLALIEEVTMLVGGLLGTVAGDNVLDLANNVVVGADMVECTDDNNICSNGAAEAVLVTALNLPWDVDIELVTIGGVSEYVLHFLTAAESGFGEPEYNADCNAPLIGLIEDICFGLTWTLLSAVVGGALLAEFMETEPAEITAPGNCTQGGVNQGLLQGNGLITSTSGALTLSE